MLAGYIAHQMLNDGWEHEMNDWHMKYIIIIIIHVIIINTLFSEGNS